MLQTFKLLQHLKSLEIYPYLDGEKFKVRDVNKRLTDELRSQIKESRAAIFDLLSAEKNNAVEAIYRLSPMQTGMLFHSQLTPNSGTYIEHALLHVDDPMFDPSRFIEAMQQVALHYDSLRAAFHVEEGNAPVQVILAQAPLPVTIVDWQTMSAEGYPTQVAALVEQDRQIDFDLTQAPLLRLTVVELGSQHGHRYDLLFTFHHILMDRWSMDLFWAAAHRVYAGLPLPQARPYQTYIHHLRQQSVDVEFWQEYISGFYAPTPLPGITIPTSAKTESHTATLVQPFSPEESQQLSDFARMQGMTMNVLFQAAWGVLLARYTDESDILFGMVTSGRTASVKGIESMVGLFINTLPFRVQLEDSPTGIDLLQQVAQTQLDLQQREHTPLLEVQRWGDIPAGTNLFDTVLLFQNTPQTVADTPQLAIRHGWVESGDTGYPLVALIAPGNRTDPTALVMSYDTARYDADTIQRILIHWQQLVMGIATQPEQPIHQLPMLTKAEYSQIVDEWNAPRGGTPLGAAVDFGEPQTIHALFEEQVTRTPNAIALVFEDKQLTYSELNERSNQLAHYLKSLADDRGGNPLGALQSGTETCVGICIERSLDLVVGVLAILKAGGTYVPLDVTYPAERLAYMLTDSQAPLLLTQRKFDQHFAVDSVERVYLDESATEIAQCATSNPTHPISPDALAYVIYTSGSTGQPKGVMIEHQALAKHALNVADVYGITPEDNILQFSAFSFDAAQEQIFEALCNGATLVMREDLLWAAEEFTQKIIDYTITLVELTPTYLQGLLNLWQQSRPDFLDGKLRLLQVSSEALLPETAHQWQELSPDTRLLNIYGPTEATVTATGFELTHYQPEVWPANLPIGCPFPGRTAYILDPQQPVPTLIPVGVPGELYIGGDGLARGYLNRPDLTSERFIDNPEFGRLYKTGDLCRWLPAPKGLPNIEFLGRVDFQVKLRGFRIELGEIENVLLAQEGVDEAVALVREEKDNKRLVAYIVQSGEVVQGEEGDPTTLQPIPECSYRGNPATLRHSLAQHLPNYMIPSAFVFLDVMPLMPNGKLDRRALPAPDSVDVQSEFVAPRTEMEAEVAAIWQEVLGIEQVGIYDNFFALGGHSLLATQVISRVRNQLNLDVPLKSLFEVSKLDDFVQIISQAQESTDRRIVPRPKGSRRDQPLPLSFAQLRLWFIDQLEPDSALYNMPTPLRFTGHLDVAALEASVRYLIERHESLRTVFGPYPNPYLNGAGGANHEGEAIQIIHPASWAAQFTLTVTPVADEDEALRLAEIEVATPFNLSEGPLLRVQLFQIASDDTTLLVLNMHHIVSDGWSMGVLVQELTYAYQAYSAGQQPTLPELPIQYADFALWQREYLSGERLEAQLDHWREELTGAPALLELPTDRPRPPVQSYQGAHYPFELSADLTAKLNQLAQAHDATLFMVMLAAFNLLLARYSRQDDIVVGSSIANRNRAETEGLIGFFVNTLVLRTQLENTPTFSELLKQVRQTTLDAYQYQDLPFEQLVETLDLERTLSYSPLFQVMLVWDALDQADPSDPSSAGTNVETGLTVTTQPTDFPFAKFDLTLDLAEQGNGAGLLGLIEYATDLFDEATIARMASHFTVMLEGIVTGNPLGAEQPVHQLPVLSEAEYHQIVDEWNDTAVDFGKPQTIHTLFEEQVTRTPNAIALVFEDKQLTYSELNERSNQLAHYLKSLADDRGGNPLGAFQSGTETCVGICLERSLDLIVGVLAILKAGGTYVPLDVTYPAERLAYMLADSQAPLLLTQRKFDQHFAVDSVERVYLDESATEIAQCATSNPTHPISPDALAYVIYTSGSTGQPKGVMIEHQALAKHALNVADVYGITPEDNILQFSAFSFDAAQEQIFEALCNGATLVMREDLLWAAEEFTQKIIDYTITLVELTPTYFQGLLNLWQQSRPDFLDGKLRLLQVSSEALLPETAHQWQELSPGTRLLNIYGPTEATVTATGFELTHYQPEVWPANLPIGCPFPGRTAYILDPQQPVPTLVPVGVPGELYIGGDGLARGYLNRPDLTAERFINHPEFGRLYKTGDLCRWLPAPKGLPNIEFLGRVDFQVKLRGLRIELGEIESALLAQEEVQEAVVIVREENGNKRLVAYLIAESQSRRVPSGRAESASDDVLTNRPIDITTLRHALAQQLPDYMIPSAFVLLDAMPLMPNGKLDRRALPAPKYADAQSEFVAPRTEAEAEMAAIWQEVLGIEQVGIYDNFFALGGHSLLATQVVSQARSQFNIELPLKELFQAKNLEELAILIAMASPSVNHDTQNKTMVEGLL